MTAGFAALIPLSDTTLSFKATFPKKAVGEITSKRDPVTCRIFLATTQGMDVLIRLKFWIAGN